MPWNPLESPVDYVTLAGQRSPGLAVVEDATSSRRWDERRGYGLSGATVVFRGNQLSHFKLTLRLITVEHWADWDAWRPLVDRPPDGQRPRALDISHPLLDMLNIHSVVVEYVEQPKQVADGEWAVEIGLIEYRRPTLALARPDGSDTQQQSVDPIDARIEALTGQLQELAGPP